MAYKNQKKQKKAVRALHRPQKLARQRKEAYEAKSKFIEGIKKQLGLSDSKIETI
jgi:hypothetical protein